MGLFGPTSLNRRDIFKNCVLGTQVEIDGFLAVFQRTHRADIDRAGNATFDQVGLLRLVDRDRLGQL